MTLAATAYDRALPRDAWPDSTVPLALEGYNFISNRRRRLGADAFTCRLLLRPAVCIGGPGAAKLFYDTNQFRRADVAPRRVLKTLLGEGGIHGLDGARHIRRKAMFLGFMGPHTLGPFRELMQRHWRHGTAEWRGHTVSVFERARLILFQALAEFAGIPLAQNEISTRTSDLAAMVDGFGGIGPRYWKGRLARLRSERWMRDIIRAVRSGAIEVNPEKAAAIIAHYRERDGQPLDEATAAVELLNVVRPVMAASYFIEYAALMLERMPNLREEVAEDAAARERFINEVRRVCPFTPFLGAEASRDVEWNGYVIPAETLTVLDVYGIHNDDRIWPRAHVFDPGRFIDRREDPYSLIPQGGGEHRIGHRCAGEWLTMEALHAATQSLARLNYSATGAPEFDLTRIPSRMRTPVILSVV